ncbi:MAG: signal peptide peptidase SppA [Rhodospirillales bacterium]|nr:signal peptide peptidase SppA [Rhodospirillales bacterium]
MSLEADYIVERRRLKRRLLFWRILALVIIGVAAITTLTNIEDIARSDHIARLNVSGIIVDDFEREQTLFELKSDDGVRALIVRIDSPGGTVVGGESLYQQLKAIGENKPVVAIMGSTATSAGYMTALGADYLIAREGSLTGSIGVLLQTADVTGLLDKIGIKPETIKSGALKAQPNPMEPLSPEARAATKEVVMDMYAMFVDMVAERRKIPLEKVKVLADGRVYSGRQALANGLIDAIGSEADAVDWLVESRKIQPGLPVQDVKIERQGQEWRQFFNGLVGKTLFSERVRLDGLVSLWHPEGW